MSKRELLYKLDRLRDTLRGLGRVLVAYSGGVDSTFLLYISLGVLGRENVLAVTSRSFVNIPSDMVNAEKYADIFKARHIYIDLDLLSCESFVSNPPNRCYHCKLKMFSKMVELAKEYGLKHIIDGTNYSDLKDFRPGMKASLEMGVISPLKDIGLSKVEVRLLCEEVGLSIGDKPSFSCFATRIPYGVPITPERIRRIRLAEEALCQMGLKGVRVREHENIARIEVYPESMGKVVQSRGIIVEKLKRLGFSYITLDLEGYRTGSLNLLVKGRKPFGPRED